MEYNFTLIRQYPGESPFNRLRRAMPSDVRIRAIKAMIRNHEVSRRVGKRLIRLIKRYAKTQPFDEIIFRLNY